MSSETNVQRRILLTLPEKFKGKVRLFRNNCGVAFQGKIVRQTKDSLLLQNPRRIDFGLIDGSSDLIGFTIITVTPEMVGRQIAVFTGYEIKTTEGAKKKKAHQEAFRENIINLGGIAATSNGEEVETLREAIEKFTGNPIDDDHRRD